MNINEVYEMSNEELSVKIAKLCGWVHEVRKVPHLPPDELLSIMCPRKQYRWTYNGNPVCVWQDDDEDAFRCIPKYATDLNAMHEAEELLTDKQLSEYNGAMMGKICSSRNATTTPELLKASLHMYRATARQRAEAFIQVTDMSGETK